MLRAFRESFKHTSIYTIGNLAGKAVGFIMIPIYTHFLAPHEYGVMDMLDLTIVLIGMLVGMGMGSAIFRFYYSSEVDRDRQEVIGSALWFSAAITGLVALVVAALARPASSLIFRSPIYAHFLQIAILAFWLSTLAETCKTYLRVKQRSVFFVTVSLVQLALSLSLNIYLIAFRRMGVMGFLLSSVISNTVIAAALMLYTVSEVGLHFSMTKTRQMLDYGLPFVFSGIGLFVLNFADRYFLNAFAGLDAVGVYALAYKFGFTINVLAVAPFLQMWQAQMFLIERERDAKETYVRMFEYFAAFILLAVLAVSLFIEYILKIAAGPEYFSAYALVPLVALAYVFSGWAQYFRLGMLLTRRTRPIATIMAGTGVVTLALYWVLIRRYHAMGAAVATVLSFALMAAWTFIVSQRIYPIPYRPRRIAALVGGAALCYAVPWIAHGVVGDKPIYDLLLRSVALAGYPLLLIQGGFFANDGVRRIRELPGGIRRLLSRSPKAPAEPEPAGDLLP